MQRVDAAAMHAVESALAARFAEPAPPAAASGAAVAWSATTVGFAPAAKASDCDGSGKGVPSRACRRVLSIAAASVLRRSPSVPPALKTTLRT